MRTLRVATAVLTLALVRGCGAEPAAGAPTVNPVWHDVALRQGSPKLLFP